MKKPKLRKEWVELAEKVGAAHQDPETGKDYTIDEIKKSIAKTLNVSVRGAKFDERLMAAIENDIKAPSSETPPAPENTEEETPKSEESSEEDTEEEQEIPEDATEVKCKILMDEENRDSILIEKGKKQVWIRKDKIYGRTEKGILIPDWLKKLKGV